MSSSAASDSVNVSEPNQVGIKQPQEIKDSKGVSKEDGKAEKPKEASTSAVTTNVTDLPKSESSDNKVSNVDADDDEIFKGEPNPEVKKSKKRKNKGNWSEFRLKMSPDAVEMWLGDIPKQLCQSRALQQVLFRQCPRGAHVPELRRLVKRAYKRNKVMYGYAVIVFRDQQDADLTTQEWNEKEIVPGFIPRLNPSTAAANGTTGGKSAVVKPETPVPEQLKTFDVCDSLSKQELVDLISQADQENSAEQLSSMTKLALVNKCTAIYEPKPIEVVEHSGVALPEALLTKIKHILDNLRWPPASQRPSMRAAHYLVLRGGKALNVYSDLSDCCKEIMAFVGDSSFQYSAVAVTKNFIGSPHIDDRDVSYQYALGIGEYDGGSLCVETLERDNRTTHVVDTKNKIAKVDGRFVHWVKPFTGKDRYSLIFYTTDAKHAVPRDKAFYELKKE